MHYLNLKYDETIKNWLAKMNYMSGGVPRYQVILHLIRETMENEEKEKKFLERLKNIWK